MRSWSRVRRIVCLICSLTTLAAGQDGGPSGDAVVDADPAQQSDIPSGGMSVAPEPTSAAEVPSASVSLAPDAATQAEVRARLASGRFRFCTSEDYRLWQLDKDRLCSKVPDL